MNFITTFLPVFSLFIIGLFGILVNRKNLLLMIFCIELILLSLNFSFLLSSFYLDDALGQVFTIFILTVAAAETSIGLAILITYYRVVGTISLEFLNLLKG
jgi:NADH-quinone oxidoreductase subunit K